MKSRIKFLLKSFCFLNLLIAPFVYASPHPVSFEAAEHIVVGENLKLYFNPKDNGQLHTQLHLENGLTFTYAQLLAISGDFYGVVGHPITDGKTLERRKENFIEAYNTLAQDPAAYSEAPKIFAIIQEEYDAVIDGIRRGQKSEDIYEKISSDNNRRWNCLTGGGCASAWWLSPGRFLALSKLDYDHFGNNAILAYQAGHAVAIDTAIQAHVTGDMKLLEKAYTINAFASHFLSDRFASGHMRTPRKELPASSSPSVLGSVLVRFMHAEENQYGLHVHNLRGDSWFASGDQYFFDPQNDENRKMLEDALQESANQVFFAYINGVAPDGDKINEVIPLPDETGLTVTRDIVPLFYWDASKGILYRRKDVSNVYDHHWISDWWAWSTILLLSRDRGLPTESQQALVAEGYGKQALSAGLITDKAIASYIKDMK